MTEKDVIGSFVIGRVVIERNVIGGGLTGRVVRKVGKCGVIMSKYLSFSKLLQNFHRSQLSVLLHASNSSQAACPCTNKLY